jgi:hypothetical protein
MQTYLSFTPRYHELTERDGKPVWVPMYNPVRQCVQAEGCRILGEFGQVDSQAWKRPKVQPLDVRPLLGALAYIVAFLMAAQAVGWLLTLAGPLAQLVATLPAERQASSVLALGGVVVTCIEAAVAVVRARRAPPTQHRPAK